MKRTKITITVLLLTVLQQISIGQTGSWKLAGNSLAGTERLGSKNNFPINFITNNSTRMSLTGTGLLGIGTTAPEGNLHIFKGSAGPVTAHPNALLVVENSTDNFIHLLAPNNIKSGILFGNPSLAVDDGIIYNNPGTERGFQFTTGNITRMALTNSGFVGIGTTAPEANLHVFKGSAGSVTAFSNAPLVVENSTNNYINLLAPDANETGILFGKPENNVSGGLIYNHSATPNGLQFRTNGNVTRMVLTNAGRLGIGTIAPAADVHFIHSTGEDGTHGFRLQNSSNGNQWTLYTSNISASLQLWANGNLRGVFDDISGDYASFSDARVKKDIEKAPDILDKVLQLDVKKYHFLKNKPDDKKHYGMIAQEVEKIFPEVVYHDKMDGSEKDYYTMNYSAFGILAIKAIQEQQQKIAEQEQTNQQQQQKIISLEDRIAKLEAAINHSSVNSAGSSNNAISKEISSATLEQNQPNPFNQSTIIRYHLPQGALGQINLYDANGTLSKTLKANESGQAVINGNDLMAGVYSYTLVVNGKMTASKKLVVIK